MTPGEEIDPILQEYLDGTLDEVGEAGLAKILSADPAAAARADEFLWIHHHAREAFSDAPEDARPLAGRVVAAIQRRQSERVREKTLRNLSMRARQHRLRTWILCGFAAAALLVSIATLLLRPAEVLPPSSPVVDQGPPDPVREELAGVQTERKKIEKRLAENERGRRELSGPSPLAPENRDPSSEEERCQELARLEESRRSIEADMKDVLERERRARDELARRAETPPAPPRPTVAEIALLERAEGLVFLGTGPGRVRVRAGRRLIPSQELETEGPGGAAVVKFPDGTRLELGSDSALREITVHEGGAKAACLERGRLVARVAPQPAGRPMLLVTPHAEARILGTMLILSVEPESTRLEVKEGRVGLKRLSDGASVNVTSARVCTASARGELAPKPLFLSARVSPAPEEFDLTAEGPDDWVHWGLETFSSINRHRYAFPRIAGVKVGNGSVHRYTNSPTAYSWKEGVPALSVRGTSTGIYITGLHEGFQVTVPADTTPRTLKVVVGVWRSVGRFEAILNEPGVPPFVDESFGHPTSESNAVGTVDYQAAGPGRTLTVRFTMARSLAVAGPLGNVTLQAAALTVERKAK
jgi:hypothetical protein